MLTELEEKIKSKANDVDLIGEEPYSLDEDEDEEGEGDDFNIHVIDVDGDDDK